MNWEKRWFQYLIIGFLAFIWGSSFILMKIGLKSFSHNQAAAIRIFSASMVLLPYSLKSLKSLKKKDLKFLLIAGFIGSLIPAFLFTKAQTRIDSALAGMLNSLTPVFTLIIGLILFRTRTRRIQILGLALGLAGALGLISSGKQIAWANIDTYAFYIIAATTCYAININVIKSRLTHLSGREITSLSFLFIGPVAFFFLIAGNLEPAKPGENWWVHLGALSVLGIVGTAFAMMIINTLIRYTTAVFSSSVTYIIPIFAILWGVLDKEPFTLNHLLFMGIILLGVYLINQKR